MINGLHVVMFSRDAAGDRAFLRDVLGWPSVEDTLSEPGWLIFKTPPAELGVHPTDGDPTAAVHLMCDDLAATLTELAAHGVEVGAVADQPYGLMSSFTLPSGTVLGLYQPKHDTAYDL